MSRVNETRRFFRFGRTFGSLLARNGPLMQPLSALSPRACRGRAMPLFRRSAVPHSPFLTRVPPLGGEPHVLGLPPAGRAYRIFVNFLARPRPPKMSPLPRELPGVLQRGIRGVLYGGLRPNVNGKVKVSLIKVKFPRKMLSAWYRPRQN